MTATATDLPRLIALMTGDDKHQAAAESTVDVLWVLYDRVLDITPENFHDPGRDRFLLSKGHGPMAYYAILAAKGFLDEDELAGWAGARSRLGHHPDRKRAPGVEISSGSLGHGLPLALGTALGLRARGHTSKVVTLVGDAELDEGSNSEAIVVAARLGLGNLTTVVVDNQSSTHGWPGGIARRFEVEGWATRTVSGRDHEALYEAFTTAHPDRPLAVVAVVEPKG
ncbi:thiamine pyrophosphate-dependent enzyme [Amycolatopsis rhabdoformis]|uniref:Thiamine pyrophosphate-dependent enzyme n=1 Tax=Amycolatopsis rhabdoformis TaxID=1448059 RepID=A0ABZ1I880_9PSEU|nr:thiamine pyrophosphate-dependent enzyme [Amycolatopsis rhabdoformis]WSE30631.1 thiamine pyrophosphate-dependent enzyme [Amycolatopsis rhabdoformis]